MYLVTDFDGVFNFDASRSKASRNKDMPGHLRRGDVYPDAWHRLNWSAELVRKLNTLHDTHSFTWVWLSTWVKHTHMLDFALGTRTDDTVDWDPDVPLNYTTDELVKTRMSRKYAALRASVKDAPFVWVDDDAKVVYNASDFSQPHLMIAPNPDYGITLPELAVITDFITNHTPVR